MGEISRREGRGEGRRRRRREEEREGRGKMYGRVVLSRREHVRVAGCVVLVIGAMVGEVVSLMGWWGGGSGGQWQNGMGKERKKARKLDGVKFYSFWLILPS